MKNEKLIIGIAIVMLLLSGCELGNQPVYYGGDILLDDNFNDYANGVQPDGWDFVDDPDVHNGPSEWYVYDTYDGIYKQALYQYSGIWGGGYNNTTYFGTTAIAGDESWTDYTFEVDFFTNCNDDGVGFDFRYVSQQDNGKGFYRLMFMNDVNNGGPFIKLLYHDYGLGQSQAIVSRNDQSYDPSIWNKIKITVIGSHITCEMNGSVIFDTVDSRLTHGCIGLFCFQQFGICFDNVLVTAKDEGNSITGNSIVD